PALRELEVARPVYCAFEYSGLFDSRHAKRAKSFLRVRYEIPRHPFRDEAERVDGAFGELAVGLAIVNGELAIARESVLHDRKKREVLRNAAPAGRVDEQTLADERGASAK